MDSLILDLPWSGTVMMNRPYMPYPSDTPICTYSPLYFMTHNMTQNIHCNTASHTKMNVDRHFVHPKTARIAPKIWTNYSSTLLGDVMSNTNFMSTFCDILSE
jgi:hypothetical protein